MKQLVLFLALGISLIGNNFLTPIVLSESLDEEKKEQLLDSNEKIIEQLKLKAYKLEESSNWDESKKYREKILSLTQKKYGINHFKTARELNNLGIVYYELEQYKKAELFYKQALEISKKINGLEHSDTVIYFGNLGRLYHSFEQYKKAEPLYKQALEISKKIVDLEDLKGLLQYNLGQLYEQLGLYKKAEPLLKETLEISKKINGLEHLNTLSRLNSLGLLYISLKQYKKAALLFKETFEISKKINGLEHPDTVIYLANHGMAYHSLGEYERAEPLYKQSLEISKKINGLEHQITESIIGDLGMLFSDAGEYKKAEPLIKQSLEISKKINGLYDSATQTGLNNLGLHYGNLGQYKKAESLIKQSLEISEKIHGLDHILTAKSMNSLGFIYTLNGDLEKAEPLYKKSLEIREKVFGIDHPSTGILQNNLGLHYGAIGQYKKAESLLKKSLESRKKIFGLDHPDVANSLNSLGMYYQKRSKDIKAESLLKQSLEIYEKVLGSDHPSTSLVSRNLGDFYISLDKYEKGNKLIKNSLISKLKFINRELPFLPLSARREFADLYKMDSSIYSNLDKNINGKEIAIFGRINTKGLLEEIEKKQSQLKFLPGPQKEIAEQLKIINQLIADSNTDRNKIQDLIRDREGLEKKLYRLMPELKTRIVNIEDVIKFMPSDSILIEYVRYHPYIKGGWKSPRYLALVLDPIKNKFDKNGVSSKYKIHAIDLGLAETLENKIKKALFSIEEGLSDAPQLLKDLGESIIKPLATVMKESKTLFITPDGELNKIPFAALGGYEGDKLLVDQIKIRLLTTGRELIDLQTKNISKKNISFVFANPSFELEREIFSEAKTIKSSFELNTSQSRSIDSRNFEWASLPGTAKEGKFIANLINADLLVGDKATAKKIMNIKNPEILHIASHSFYLKNQENNIESLNYSLITKNSKPLKYFAKNENPLLRSGIVLAGANNPNLIQEDDGYLTALEITQLDWNGTELVVISGCESGLGDIKNGDGIYGLKRAISVAGAKSSLLSLWKVDDQATAVFMKSFYERLIAGEGRAEALINTQREFRNHKNKNYRHPYFWAAFQLSGDWRPIDF